MQKSELTIAGRRVAANAWRGLLLVVVAVALAGCNTTTPLDTTGAIPNDYRDRHPITVKEGRKSLALFVSAGRGGLSPSQRAEVLAFAQNWRRDATGGITIDRPVGGPNQRAASDSLKEAISILVQAGVPNHGIGVRPYHAAEVARADLRLNFPLMVGHAGPCGLWPDDVGPSYQPKHFENKEYYNLGCAQQHNIATMVANPADLVQPRAEAPVYAAKRTFQIDKWRKGDGPTTTYTDAQKGAISDLGK
jgi:pilus assembly protein CpaD